MISYLAQPNTIEPSYSNLVFQFLSTGATDSSKYKYRYVVDVYIQEGSDEQDGQVAQLKITPSSEGWTSRYIPHLKKLHTFKTCKCGL